MFSPLSPVLCANPLITSIGLHATAEHAATSSLPLCLPLHLLANLDIDLEELRDTAIEAHGLALVEVCFAVRRVDALLAAGLDQARPPEKVSGVSQLAVETTGGGCGERNVPRVHVRDHVDFCFCLGDLLLGGELGLAAEEEGHCGGWCSVLRGKGWVLVEMIGCGGCGLEAMERC